MSAEIRSGSARFDPGDQTAVSGGQTTHYTLLGTQTGIFWQSDRQLLNHLEQLI
jgi:hypothetical protein